MIDRELLRVLRSQIEQALKPIGKQHKLTFTVGNISFNPTNATAKLQFATIGKGGEVNTKERTEFKQLGKMYGFKETDLDKVVSLPNGARSHKYKIVGLKLRSRAYPVLVEEQDSGRRYKFSMRTVLQALGRKVPKDGPGVLMY